jgi:hypothetical protein
MIEKIKYLGKRASRNVVLSIKSNFNKWKNKDKCFGLQI